MSELKERVQELESEIAYLKNTNSGSGPTPEERIYEHRQKQAQALAAILMNQDLPPEERDAEAQKLVDELSHSTMVYGRERSALIDYHLTRLAEALAPTPQAKLIAWGFRQPPHFFDQVAPAAGGDAVDDLVEDIDRAFAAM